MARSLPHSQEAEERVIGAILLDPRCLAKVADILQPESFLCRAPRLLYEAALRLDQRGHLNRFLMEEETRDLLRFCDGGAVTYIAQLVSAVHLTAPIRTWAERVHQLAQLRAQIDVGERMVARAYAADGHSAAECLDRAQSEIFAIARPGVAGPVPNRAIVPGVVEQLRERGRLGGRLPGVSTGHLAVDALTGGLQLADLFVLAARPSMGKTALMWVWAEAAAFQGVPVLVFSLEMSKEALLLRGVSWAARIPAAQLRLGVSAADDLRRLQDAAQVLSGIDMEIDDSGSPTLMEIRAKARRWRSERPPGPALIAIDYLQLVKGERRGKDYSREREIAEISGGLKSLAKELNVAVLALAQLNRSVESRPKTDRRPRLADLRESGSLEQDADLVAFIYRDEVYRRCKKCNNSPVIPCAECKKGIAEVIIAKQRNGAIGTAELAFLGEYMRFENLARDRQLEVPGA